MVDPIFADPRLASIYDVLDDDRSDLDAYLALVDELGARSVLDVGCGTGTLACLLAGRGIDVTGVDPAAASLAVARRKPAADRVCWIEGDVAALPPLSVDVVTMTGNVGQVFLTDESWAATLEGCRRALVPRGMLAFEVREPSAEAWLGWTRAGSWRRVPLPGGGGTVETWVDTTAVDLPYVSFRWTYRFDRDGAELTSESTLRFRTDAEIRRSLVEAGLTVQEVRDAPDRPGLELVYLTRPT
jgi:SAM-dependent methyltransferase